MTDPVRRNRRTLYVLIVLFFLPVANKLKVAVHSRSHLCEMQVEGLIGIAQGENPRIIEGKLLGFLH